MKEIRNELVRSVLEYLKPENIFDDLIKLEESNLTLGQQSFELNEFENIHLIAAGKAASYELKAIKDKLLKLGLGDKIIQSVAVTKIDHSVDDSSLIQIEGTHPEITELNIKNTNTFIEYLRKINSNDLTIFALSGGASALLELPRKEIQQNLLFEINRDLLHSGKNINEMNMIRKSLFQVKNGGLLNFISSTHIVQFINCDIPNADLADVSSGPLLYKDLDYTKINNYLGKFSLKLEPNEKQNTQSEIMTFPSSSAKSLINNLKLPNFPNITRGSIYDVLLPELISEFRMRIKHLNKTKFLFISGGEATINIPKNPGKGGRNTHFVLELARVIYQDENNRDIKILSLGTDGTDGPTDAAGAYIDFEMYSKLEANDYIENFDSYHYFEKVDGLIKTGATGTNVMDIRFIWKD